MGKTLPTFLMIRRMTMAQNKQLYIEMELQWAENQLATWRQYIDENPINEMADRVQMKVTKTGGAIPLVVSTIENQIKSVRETMKEYLALLKEVNKMREEEEKRLEIKGGGDVPYRMR